MLKDLFFLNSRELSGRLSREEISDEVAFNHLLIHSMLSASYIALPVVVSCSSSEGSARWFQALSFIVCAGVQYWGMRMLYRTNESGDGKAFFLRWATLSLPVGIQVWIIALLLGAVYGGVVGLSVGGWASGAPDFTWLLTSLLFGVLMQFIYFRLMQKNLKSCSANA